MSEQTEVWKQIKTRYSDIEISNFGNVRGKRWNRHSFTKNDIKIIKGRKCIGHQPLYSLVWHAFNESVPTGYCIHHIDHNKLNDNLDNLMLMTIEDHSKHHNTDPSNTKRKKMSEAKKGKKRPKQSAAIRGRKASTETKLKMTMSRLNRHWFNNGANEIFCYECPEGFINGRLKRKKGA